MTTRKAIMLVLIVLAAAAIWVWNSEWLKIDRCLDDGGRWDDVSKNCQFATGVKI